MPRRSTLALPAQPFVPPRVWLRHSRWAGMLLRGALLMAAWAGLLLAAGLGRMGGG